MPERSEKTRIGLWLKLAGQVTGLAIKVHKAVGPGLLEQIYEDCLCHKTTLNSMAFQRQVKLSLGLQWCAAFTDLSGR